MTPTGGCYECKMKACRCYSFIHSFIHCIRYLSLIGVWGFGKDQRTNIIETHVFKNEPPYSTVDTMIIPSSVCYYLELRNVIVSYS